MDAKAHVAQLLRDALRAVAPEVQIEPALERPRDAAHGDYACTAALQLARSLGRKPREIAEAVVAAMRALPGWRDGVLSDCAVAGPGFINLRLSPAAKQAVVRRALADGPDYGRGTPLVAQRILVEFVSANPTGPLHVGHGRCAAYGASLANLLAFAGHRVEREFYVNDAGRQVDILALCVWLRYLEEHGRPTQFPEDGYRGAYVQELARELAAAHGPRFLREPPPPGSGTTPEAALDAQISAARDRLGGDWDAVVEFARERLLADQRDDLAAFGVTFDRWVSERSLQASGAVERTVAALTARGHAYEKDGALWFRASAFGDEKDRVLRRDNGQYTYFAADIAYHADKFARGYDRLIDVWGADHHGYVARVRGALAALGLPVERLEIALYQFAVLWRDGEKLAMGKRSGEFVTLRELRSEVGRDAARFFYVLRKADQHLDFDLDLARSESLDNPVYYVQYAHARVASLFAQWGGDARRLVHADLSGLVAPRELALMQRCAEFPDAVAEAAAELAPHRIAFYLRELAADFHGYYNAERILVPDDRLRQARLALCAAVRQTIANGLALLGVSAPERM